jgi:hypothetical protein
MKIKSFFAKPYAAIVHKKIQKEMRTAVQDQERIFKDLLKHGSFTQFGNDHRLRDVQQYDAYSQAIPVHTYDMLKPYLEHIKEGKSNVLWKGRPLYFAKTSGTTNTVKYIPISRESIHNQVNSARNVLLSYMATSRNADFANGNMIFLSDPPTLERFAGIPTGRLSGIINHHVPAYMRNNQFPSYETNCIENWEDKLARIVAETMNKDLTLISGMPTWIQMYLDWLLEHSQKHNIKHLFPSLQVLIHSGANFDVYRSRLKECVGFDIDTLETYPTSEGFFAFQDSVQADGMLLNTNSGIFYEFIPISEIHKDQPRRLRLQDVELGQKYVLIISSNAGLWGYNMGDIVQFVSLDPYRIIVKGRVKHYISLFGEQVISHDVERAMLAATNQHQLRVVDFIVAPQTQSEGAPYYEWLIAADAPLSDMETRAFEVTIDHMLRMQNKAYDNLIVEHQLQASRVRFLPGNAFQQYMKSIGKLGGQHKLPRLSNNYELAAQLSASSITI